MFRLFIGYLIGDFVSLLTEKLSNEAFEEENFGSVVYVDPYFMARKNIYQLKDLKISWHYSTYGFNLKKIHISIEYLIY